MLKVFLVEDEIIVREGIRDRINWADNGFEFSGEASDGELAYPMIQQIKPDIVITDIKMPFMDGLALSRLIRNELPWTKIIILSGYDEFQYAKEAINIGVTDYLLKPIGSSKVLETLLKIRDNIEEERNLREMQIRYRKEMQENENYQRRQFFSQLISDSSSVPEILNRANELDIDLAAKSYNILLFICSQKDESSWEKYSGKLVQMEEKIENNFSMRKHMILFRRGLEGWALLIKGTDHESAESVTKRCITELENLFQSDQSMDYFIGVGMPVERLQQIPQAFQKANRAFVYRYIVEDNKIEYYSFDPKPAITSQNGFSLKLLDPSKLSQSVIDRFLRSGLKENVSQFVEDYIESIGLDSGNSLSFRKYIVTNILIGVSAFLDEIGIGKHVIIDSFGDIEQITEKVTTLSCTKELIEEIFDVALDFRDNNSKQKYANLLSAAETYIRENYNSEDISLNLVAQVTNVSPSYFSSIFSQEKGITFIEFLTNVRIEKAKELLRSTTLRSSEISQAVGYKDSHYFSYLFKKETGLTPREYRTGKEENN